MLSCRAAPAKLPLATTRANIVRLVKRSIVVHHQASASYGEA
jgi:hypothetical protein